MKANRPPDQETLKLIEALQQQDQVIRQLMERDQQGRRLIWQLVQMAGGTVVLPAEPAPVLWTLAFKRTEDADKKIIIAASILAEPTEVTLGQLAAILRGSDKELTVAMEEARLSEYPPSAIERALAEKHVIWSVNDRKWLDAEVARRMIPPAQPGAN